MLGHSRPVAIRANVDTNEFNPLGEDGGFLKAQQEILRLSNPKLTLHVCQGRCQRLGVTKNVVNTDVGISILVNYNALLVR